MFHIHYKKPFLDIQRRLFFYFLICKIGSNFILFLLLKIELFYLFDDFFSSKINSNYKFKRKFSFLNSFKLLFFLQNNNFRINFYFCSKIHFLQMISFSQKNKKSIKTALSICKKHYVINCI